VLHGLICGITLNVLNTSLKTKLTKVNLSFVSLYLSLSFSCFVRVYSMTEIIGGLSALGIVTIGRCGGPFGGPGRGPPGR